MTADYLHYYRSDIREISAGTALNDEVAEI